MQTKTSLSAGADLCAMLLAEPRIAGTVTDVYPIIADEATLPYITYRCAQAVTADTKGDGERDRVIYEVTVCAETYDQSVELAEAVRAALYHKRCGLIARARLRNHSDGYAGDCIYQLLTYEFTINQLNS